MYDLHVPVERYEAEKNKISDLLVNVDENKELVSGFSDYIVVIVIHWKFSFVFRIP